MKITLDEAVEILQKEIVWCLDNPDPTLNKDQQMGFMNGLRQAQYLLRAAEHCVQADGACACPEYINEPMTTAFRCAFCGKPPRR